MIGNDSGLYDDLYQNALALQELGVKERNIDALVTAKQSVESILLHKIRIIFEIPTRIDIPKNFLDDAGIKQIIQRVENSLKKHIDNPGSDSNPFIPDADKPQLSAIAEEVGWSKYLLQNENITLHMAKRLRIAIQEQLIGKNSGGLSLDPHFEANRRHAIVRYNQGVGANRIGFRSSKGRIKG